MARVHTTGQPAAVTVRPMVQAAEVQLDGDSRQACDARTMVGTSATFLPDFFCLRVQARMSAAFVNTGSSSSAAIVAVPAKKKQATVWQCPLHCDRVVLCSCGRWRGCGGCGG